MSESICGKCGGMKVFLSNNTNIPTFIKWCSCGNAAPDETIHATIQRLTSEGWIDVKPLDIRREKAPHGIAYRARTPEQKREVIERLLAVWAANPELRLGQIIVNVYRDAYYVEDLDLIDALERFYADVKGKDE